MDSGVLQFDISSDLNSVHPDYGLVDFGLKFDLKHSEALRDVLWEDSPFIFNFKTYFQL
jgi:hypothetical protein